MKEKPDFKSKSIVSSITSNDIHQRLYRTVSSLEDSDDTLENTQILKTCSASSIFIDRKNPFGIRGQGIWDSIHMWKHILVMLVVGVILAWISLARAIVFLKWILLCEACWLSWGTSSCLYLFIYSTCLRTSIFWHLFTSIFNFFFLSLLLGSSTKTKILMYTSIDSN